MKILTSIIGAFLRIKSGEKKFTINRELTGTKIISL